MTARRGAQGLEVVDRSLGVSGLGESRRHFLTVRSQMTRLHVGTHLY